MQLQFFRDMKRQVSNHNKLFEVLLCHAVALLKNVYGVCFLFHIVCREAPLVTSPAPNTKIV